MTVLLGFGSVVFDGGNTISTGVTIWGTCFVTIEGITFRRFTATTTAGLPFAAAAVVIGSPGVDYPASFNILKSLSVTESSLLNFSGPHAEIAIWCTTCSNNTVAESRIESTQPVAIAVGSDETSPVDQGGAILDNWIIHARDNHPWIGVYALRTSIWTMDGNYLEEGSLPDGSTDLVQVNESAKWTFTNNVFFRPPASAINLVDNTSGGDLVEQDRLLNNTIECTDTIGTGVRCEMCSATQVRNNIIAGCSAAVALVSGCLNTQLGYNDLFSNYRNYDLSGLGYGYTLVGSDIFDDPKFQAVTPRPDPYYLLLELSPAINAGDDAKCGTVPLDGHCDMGAYQAVTTLGNDPPFQPAIVSVGQVTGRSAVLRGSAFSDPDAGDTQKASQWQVDEASGDFTHPVYDSGRTTADLLSIQAGGLAASTDYQARVRYQDIGGLWSPWSDPSLAPAQFTTLEATAIPPKVTSVDPAQGAKGVSVSVAPVLVFNVPLEAASVSTSTVKLKKGDKVITQAAGSPALCTCGEIVTITAAGLLNPNTEYKIVARGGSTGIQSRDGSVPGKDFSSTFTTETALAGSDPTAGATGVPTTVTPALSFKWALDPARVNDVTFMLKDTTAGRDRLPVFRDPGPGRDHRHADADGRPEAAPPVPRPGSFGLGRPSLHRRAPARHGHQDQLQDRGDVNERMRDRGRGSLTGVGAAPRIRGSESARDAVPMSGRGAAW